MKISQRKFVEELAATCYLTNREATKIVDSFKRLIYKKLSEGHSIELSGFGLFTISHRTPRLGVNPRTGLPITIPELVTPKFRAGVAMKQAVKLKK